MENTEEKVVVEETKEVKETAPTIDYDKINNLVNQSVEKEVGKFIKNFIENNSTKEEVKVETKEESELDKWRI